MKGKICGIYRILCTESGKVYIGSSVDIHKRLSRHREDLRKGIHHSVLLQRAYIKYGKDSFTFIILWECEDYWLTFRETEYIRLYDSVNPKFGYNIVLPDFSRPIHHPISEETRQKLKVAHRGKNISEEQRKKMRRAGEEHGMSKLSLKDIQSIRDLYLKGCRQRELSRLFKLSPTQICAIVNNTSWVDDSYIPPTCIKNIGENNRGSKLQKEDVLSIRERHSKGDTVTNISRTFGVSFMTIRDVITGKTWKWL